MEDRKKAVPDKSIPQAGAPGKRRTSQSTTAPMHVPTATPPTQKLVKETTIMEEKGMRSARRLKSTVPVEAPDYQMVVEENVLAEGSEVEDVEENLSQPEEPEEEVIEPAPVEEEDVVDIGDEAEQDHEEDVEDGAEESAHDEHKQDDQKKEVKVYLIQQVDGVEEEEALVVTEDLLTEPKEQEQDDQLQESGQLHEENQSEHDSQEGQKKEVKVYVIQQVDGATGEEGEEGMLMITEDVLTKADEQEEDQRQDDQLQDSDQLHKENKTNKEVKVYVIQQVDGAGEEETLVVREDVLSEADIQPTVKPKVAENVRRRNETLTNEEVKPPKRKTKSKTKELRKLETEDINGELGRLREGSTSEAPEASNIKVSILYSQSEGRVLFLEAGKDFVDLLMNLLLLPIGCIVKLLRDNKADVSELGAIVRLFQSVEKMERPIMLVDNEVLMKPQSALNERPLSPQIQNGYVKDSLIFTITDELDVFPSSTIKSLALLNKLQVENMADLKILEVTVDTTKDMLRLLRASLTSKSVLNHVFRSRLPTYNQNLP